MQPSTSEIFVPDASIRLPGTRLGRLLERLAKEQPQPTSADLVFDGEEKIRVRGSQS